MNSYRCQSCGHIVQLNRQHRRKFEREPQYHGCTNCGAKGKFISVDETADKYVTESITD